jgi:hypothetical protein
LHQHLLAFTQLAEEYALALAVVVQAQAGRRQQFHQLRGRGGGALSRTALQIAPGEQEQGEHAHGVEIQFALAGDGRPDPGHVGAADGQRHRYVHGQVPGAQVAQGATEELAAAIEDDRRGEEQAGPAQDLVQFRRQVDVEFRPGGHGRHHHLHPQKPRHAQLAHASTVFRSQAFGRFVGAPGVSGVADAAQFGEQLAQGDLAVLPAHLQAMVGQVQVRFGHTRHTAQVLLDQPAAGGAADALDQQLGFAQFALVLDEGLLHVAAVVQRQFVRQGCRQRLWIGGVLAAMTVIVLQASGDDGFGHGLATGAAHLAGLTEHIGTELAAGRYRQATVIAGSRGGHWQRQ